MQERAFRIDPLLTVHFGPDCFTCGALFLFSGHIDRRPVKKGTEPHPKH